MVSSIMAQKDVPGSSHASILFSVYLILSYSEIRLVSGLMVSLWKRNLNPEILLYNHLNLFKIKGEESVSDVRGKCDQENTSIHSNHN